MDGKRLIAVVASFAGLLALGGCTGLPECPGCSPALAAQVPPPARVGTETRRAYRQIETRLDTRAPYHHAVLAPDDYLSPHPFFLIGIEKPRKHAVRPYQRCPGDRGNSPVFDVERMEGIDPGTRNDIRDRLFGDPRSMVPTHVLRLGRKGGGGPCFLFNVYDREGRVSPCAHHVDVDALRTEDWTLTAWKALDALGAAVADAVKERQATHIIILATGWNTREYESYRDFKAWVDALDQDFHDAAFRPVFVGIAWESEWPWWSKVPLVGPTLSFTTKGNDADEIGFTWANYLLNDVLASVAERSGARLVAIGHSFGSRIVFGGHYVRHILVRNKEVADRPVTLIGLQAAFPIDRFVLEEGKEHPYVASNRGQAVVVVTASETDAATAKGPGHGYAGSEKGMQRVRNKSGIFKGVVEILKTNSNGEPLDVPLTDGVSLYDATPFVNCELPGTSSGSHSDVYDAQMGHFMGEIIRSGGWRIERAA